MGRILVVGETPLIHSGFANVLRRLNAHFMDLGHEVEQIGWCQLNDMEHSLGYKIHPVKYPKGNYYGADIFDEVVLTFNPDIVFSLGDIYMVDWIAKASTRDRFKWVSYFPIDSKPIPSYWCESVKHMDYPITYSKFGHRVVKEQVPSRAQDVRMIYHGIDTSVYYPEDKAKVRAEMQVPEDTFVLTYVGVNSVRKQIPRLLAAFDIFAKDKKDVLLYLHTSIQHNAGKEGWFLKEVIMQYNIVDKLIVSKEAGPMARVPEEIMRKIYSFSDVFVSATKCEGFGLPFVEAGACGVPSIAVNYSSMPELIKGRGELVAASDWVHMCPNGMIRPLINIKQFAQKMDKLYNNRVLLEKYGAAAYDFAQTLSWDKILPKFDVVIQNALTDTKKVVEVEKPDLDVVVI